MLQSSRTEEQWHFRSISDAVDFMISKNRFIKKNSAIVSLSIRIKKNDFTPFKGYSVARW